MHNYVYLCSKISSSLGQLSLCFFYVRTYVRVHVSCKPCHPHDEVFCSHFVQNQEFKDHPENFKSIGDFTLDGEGGSDVPKGSAKKKLASKGNRQQSIGTYVCVQRLLICTGTYMCMYCFLFPSE